ncbi:MAG: TIGR03089 family protein [Nocardioidaceae bacterium]|nr:TIGR03089 family protein [Nocardioidaceae bacterium]
MPQPATLVTTALANALAIAPGSPLVTYYDASSGERIELSVKTFENWMSKIANLLSDDLGLEAGQSIKVALPTHWQSTVTVVAAWAAGLRVIATDASVAADVTVVGPTALANGAERPAGIVIACSLRPLGGAFVEPLPAGWLDFAREVTGQPDIMLVQQYISGGDIAVELAGRSVTHAELTQEALDTAARLGLRPGGRLITNANPADPTGLVSALVAPLVTGSSVVLVVGAGAAARTRIAAQEHSDCALWLDR